MEAQRVPSPLHESKPSRAAAALKASFYDGEGLPRTQLERFQPWIRTKVSPLCAHPEIQQVALTSCTPVLTPRAHERFCQVSCKDSVALRLGNSDMQYSSIIAETTPQERVPVSFFTDLTGMQRMIKASSKTAHNLFHTSRNPLPVSKASEDERVMNTERPNNGWIQDPRPLPTPRISKQLVTSPRSANAVRSSRPETAHAPHLHPARNPQRLNFELTRDRPCVRVQHSPSKQTEASFSGSPFLLRRPETAQSSRMHPGRNPQRLNFELTRDRPCVRSQAPELNMSAFGQQDTSQVVMATPFDSVRGGNIPLTAGSATSSDAHRLRSKATEIIVQQLVAMEVEETMARRAAAGCSTVIDAMKWIFKNEQSVISSLEDRWRARCSVDATKALVRSGDGAARSGVAELRDAHVTSSRHGQVGHKRLNAAHNFLAVDAQHQPFVPDKGSSQGRGSSHHKRLIAAHRFLAGETCRVGAPRRSKGSQTARGSAALGSSNRLGRATTDVASICINLNPAPTTSRTSSFVGTRHCRAGRASDAGSINIELMSDLSAEV